MTTFVWRNWLIPPRTGDWGVWRVALAGVDPRPTNNILKSKKSMARVPVRLDINGA